MAISSFAELAQLLGPRIEAALDQRTQLGEGCPTHLWEAMRYSLLAPGKRLRPMLVLLAAQACGGTIETAMPAACAVEMIHTYSLIHDDLPALDNDDLRRGRPTCHKAFDEPTAILAGDALLTLAFEVLAREVEPKATAAACTAALAEAAGPCNMVGGQADDVMGGLVPQPCSVDTSGATAGLSSSAENTGGQATRGTRQFTPVGPLVASGQWPVASDKAAGGMDQLESIHRRKTGAMICVSLKLGALTAGASPRQLDALDVYGRRLGLAFQITDDLLDVRSSEAAMGKRVGKDAAQGKLTFPGVLGVDESARRAKRLVQEACEALGTDASSERLFGEEAEGLRTVARFVLERNR